MKALPPNAESTSSGNKTPTKQYDHHPATRSYAHMEGIGYPGGDKCKHGRVFSRVAEKENVAVLSVHVLKQNNDAITCIVIDP